MRALGLGAAQRCEDALDEKCECRCKGSLHGAKRGSVMRLKMGDPHSLMKPCKVCEGKGIWGFGNWKCTTCYGRGWCLPWRYRKMQGWNDPVAEAI